MGANKQPETKPMPSFEIAKQRRAMDPPSSWQQAIDENDGRDATLRPGDFAIHDSTRPYALSFETAFSQVIYQIPRNLLRQRLGCFDHYTAVKVSGQNQLGKLASDFMVNAGRLNDQIEPGVAERLSLQAIDLMSLALSTETSAQTYGCRSSHRSALLYRAKSFVDSHLREKINPALLATALGCSTRYVNGLFADENTTLGEYVLMRRLEHCRSDLADGPRGRRVSEIAYAWGFNSSGHFCRSFKARFNASPSEYRDRAGSERCSK
jgi:AraC-like DNA-binding protein